MFERNRLFIAAALAVSSGAAMADTFDVTRFDDPAGSCGGGDRSLRQAVLAAAATPGADTITLHKGTYRLALRGDDDTAVAGDLDVAGAVTIEGDPAGGTVIDAKGAKCRVFQVSPSGDLTIRRVRMRGGNASTSGGAILNAGVLTVENSTFTGNRAGDSGGAIAGEGGNCTLTDVVIARNVAAADGGGCAFKLGGSATLARVVVGGNRAAGAGGGVNGDAATVIMVECTVAGNTSKRDGGGLALAVGSTLLQNVTLSGNRSATGGGLHLAASGAALLNFVTIARNRAREGDGIWTEPGTVATVFSTLVVQNSRSDSFGGFISRGSNVVGRTDGRAITGDTAGDVVGGATPLRLRLGPLAANGGATPTHALLPARSTAGAAAPICPPFVGDERGPPPTEPCDVGATTNRKL